MRQSAAGIDTDFPNTHKHTNCNQPCTFPFAELPSPEVINVKAFGADKVKVIITLQHTQYSIYGVYVKYHLTFCANDTSEARCTNAELTKRSATTVSCEEWFSF